MSGSLSARSVRIPTTALRIKKCQSPQMFSKCPCFPSQSNSRIILLLASTGPSMPPFCHFLRLLSVHHLPSGPHMTLAWTHAPRCLSQDAPGDWRLLPLLLRAHLQRNLVNPDRSKRRNKINASSSWNFFNNVKVGAVSAFRQGDGRDPVVHAASFLTKHTQSIQRSVLPWVGTRTRD